MLQAKEKKAGLKDMERLEVLFLLGKYHRRLGETKKSKAYFALLKTVKYKDDDGKMKTGHPYFVELVASREHPPKADAAGNPAQKNAK